MIVAIVEVDVALVEDRSPLEWCSYAWSVCVAAMGDRLLLTMLLLARRAMAQLARQWRVPAQLEFDLSAMTAAVQNRLEIRVPLVNHVRLSVLPQILLRDLLAIWRLDLLLGHVGVCSLRHLDGW